jgi:hypothetical protein
VAVSVGCSRRRLSLGNENHVLAPTSDFETSASIQLEIAHRPRGNTLEGILWLQLWSECVRGLRILHSSNSTHVSLQNLPAWTLSSGVVGRMLLPVCLRTTNLNFLFWISASPLPYLHVASHLQQHMRRPPYSQTQLYFSSRAQPSTCHFGFDQILISSSHASNDNSILDERAH